VWTRSNHPRAIGCVAVATLLAACLISEPAQAKAPAEGRIVSVALGAAMFSSYPMSREDPGPSLALSTPWWIGKNHRWIQLHADLGLLAGWGVDSGHAHLSLGPRFGANIYMGPVVGLEIIVGLGGLAQVGPRTVFGLGFVGQSAWVFRLSRDGQPRLKLQMQMHSGGYFADDPGNDLGTNAMALGLGLALERPW